MGLGEPIDREHTVDSHFIRGTVVTSVAVDLDAFPITITFDETVLAHSLVASLFDIATGAVMAGQNGPVHVLNLDSTAAVSNADSTSVTITIGEQDANVIKTLETVAISSATSCLIFGTSAVSDMAVIENNIVA